MRKDVTNLVLTVTTGQENDAKSRLLADSLVVSGVPTMLPRPVGNGRVAVQQTKPPILT